MAKRTPSGLEIDAKIAEQVSPIMELIEQSKSHTANHQKQLDLLQQGQRLVEQSVEKNSTELKEAQKELEQLPPLDKKLKKLAATSVGDTEFKQAMKDLHLAIGLTMHMLQKLPGSLKQMDTQLTGMAALLKAVLEVSRAPIQLSNDASAQLSNSIKKQLVESITKEIGSQATKARGELVKEVSENIQLPINHAVRDMNQTLESMKLETEKQENIRKQNQALLERNEELAKRGAQFTVSALAWVAVIAVGFIATGFLGYGLMEALGLTVSLPAMWERVWGAQTWYGGLGWFAATVGLTGSLIALVGWAAYRLVKPVSDLLKHSD